MKYRYANISGSTAQDLIVRVPERTGVVPGSVTVEKCRIANTYSAEIVVDVYLELINWYETEKLYGPKPVRTDPSDPEPEFLDTSLRVTETYYFIKSLAIPTGTAVDIFDGSPCTYIANNALKIKLATSNDTADIALAYTSTPSTESTETRTRRQMNQY